jgi:hypothetical protein
MKELSNLNQSLDELNQFNNEIENKIKNIFKGNKGNLEQYCISLFNNFDSIIGNYKITIEKNNINLINSPTEFILLNSAFEGLVKILLINDDYLKFLNSLKGNRTLHKLKEDFIYMIKQKEKDSKKIEIISSIYDLFKNLRNNFVHFPFYSHIDYRFEYLYFQMFSYLLELNNYWNYLSNEISDYIKIKSKDVPSGIDILEGISLY